ncbi:MAG: hypothetical protein MI924_05145 [Chloroflexales bacterium]|nr:hypothetical protein [Chloroflexales bacterium]
MRKRLIGLIVLFASVALLPALGRTQENPNRAGLVVQYGDGQIETACVAFDEEQISGLELLARSGIPYVAQQSGGSAAVCKIRGDGCDYPAEDCFCKREGLRSVYWAYHLLADDAWRYSNQGVSSVWVQDGDVQGWAWGVGDSNQGVQPPALSFAQICDATAEAPPSPAPPIEETNVALSPAEATPPPNIPSLTTPASLAATETAPTTASEATAPTGGLATPTPGSQPSTATPQMVETATAQPPTPADMPTSPPTATASGAEPTQTDQAAGGAAAPTALAAAETGGAAPAQQFNYVLFGVLVLILLAGIGVLALRSRSSM